MEIKKDQKAWIVGLSIACPHGQEMSECPVRHIRDKSLRERIKMINDMADERIGKYLHHHAKCSTVRSATYT
jgi:hypothetical protein